MAVTYATYQWPLTEAHEREGIDMFTRAPR